jgi:hypothetical protein
MGRVGMRMWKTDVKVNCAKKQRMKSRVNIFCVAISSLCEGRDSYIVLKWRWEGRGTLAP